MMLPISKITRNGKVLAERTPEYSRAHDDRLKINDAGSDPVRKGQRLKFYVQGLRKPWEGEVLWYDEADGWIVLWTPKLPPSVSLLHPSLGLLTEAAERHGAVDDHPVQCSSRAEAIAAAAAGQMRAAGATIRGAGMGQVG